MYEVIRMSCWGESLGLEHIHDLQTIQQVGAFTISSFFWGLSWLTDFIYLIGKSAKTFYVFYSHA
jgi:hypothetical protein